MNGEAKCNCQHCGGHIAFPSEAAGQTVECPHCKGETLLSVPSAETSHIVNCPCQHCNGAIEFEADDLSEENSVIPCPLCGLETKLFIPSTADDSNSDAPVQEETLQSPQADSVASVAARKAEDEKMIEKMISSRMIHYLLDTLELAGDTITICKRGWANALASGMNGERTIQIPTLTSVQMKSASWLTPGYILFSYAGSKPFMGGIIDATQDPDAFMFRPEQNAEVAEFKALVEQKMRESRQPAPANNSKGNSLADELRSLAELKQQGVLTAEEFEAAKKKLLS